MPSTPEARSEAQAAGRDRRTTKHRTQRRSLRPADRASTNARVAPVRAALRRTHPVAWAIAGLVALAFLLRLGPMQQSMYGDELFLYAIVHDRSIGDVLDVVYDTEKTPPLGFLLAWLFEHGDGSDVLVRIPSLVAGLSLIPAAYLLGLRTVGRWAGAFAAAWIALSSFQIFYATESRSYALVEFLVVCSTLLLLLALEKRRTGWWVAFAAATACAAYTHYIAILVLGPQAAWALWTHRDQARSILSSQIAVVIAYLPWVPGFLEQARNSSGEAGELDELAPTTLDHVATISTKALAGHPFPPLSEFPGRFALVLLGAVLLSAGIYALWMARRRGQAPRLSLATPVGLLAILATAPVIGQVLYSLRPDTSFLIPRNLIIAVPYVLLLVGALLTSLRPRVVALGLSALALVAVVFGTVDSQRSSYARADARWAAQVVDRGVGRDASVVNGQVLYSSIPPGRALFYYLRRPHHEFRAGELNEAWRRAAASGSAVAMASPSAPAVLSLLSVPLAYRNRYRLTSQQSPARVSRPVLRSGYGCRGSRARRRSGRSHQELWQCGGGSCTRQWRLRMCQPGGVSWPSGSTPGQQAMREQPQIGSPHFPRKCALAGENLERPPTAATSGGGLIIRRSLVRVQVGPLKTPANPHVAGRGAESVSPACPEKRDLPS